MSRWIEAEWIRNIYADFEHYENRDDWTTPIANVLAVIDDAPSIDIVRCKECKHWHEFIDAKGQGRCEADAHKPFRVSIGVSYADFFCSYGERKE